MWTAIHSSTISSWGHCTAWNNSVVVCWPLIVENMAILLLLLLLWLFDDNDDAVDADVPDDVADDDDDTDSLFNEDEMLFDDKRLLFVDGCANLTVLYWLRLNRDDICLSVAAMV